jgi:hypothetical protein
MWSTARGDGLFPCLDSDVDSDLATQDLDVYNEDGDQVGTVDTNVMTSNILGIETTQFTIEEVNAADGAAGSDLPDEETVYSVTDLGVGFENVYIAVPGDGGAQSITDTFVTPWDLL